jgi:hypothetical protein
MCLDSKIVAWGYDVIRSREKQTQQRQHLCDAERSRRLACRQAYLSLQPATEARRFWFLHNGPLGSHLSHPFRPKPPTSVHASDSISMAHTRYPCNMVWQWLDTVWSWIVKCGATLILSRSKGWLNYSFTSITQGNVY